MADSALLFLQHPLGDPTTFPCAHLEVAHPNGHAVTVPCLHGFKPKHPDGDLIQTWFGEKRVPCIHLEPIHPNGHTATVPCAHVQPAHPDGHPGPPLPCSHPLPVVREEFNGGLKFYTNNSLIQDLVMQAVGALAELGVVLAPAIRPLHIFFRAPIGDGDSSDPFWHHYSPLFHSIQIMDTGQGEQAIRETLFHEIGHALLGHTPINHFAGGPHGMTTPAANYALAMSEGWAHFVALVLNKRLGLAEPDNYRGLDWENLSIDPNGKIEYCVGTFLWDLFDRFRIEFEQSSGRIVGIGDELLSLPFSQLFGVYSPTLEAIANGPWVSSVWDYADRLTQVFEDSPIDVSQINSILLANCGAKPADAEPLPQIVTGVSAAVSEWFRGD
ncbi:MAG: hypothetical protein CMJ94_11970 [Planctomycetes bacterium]|nr:hypothetical protein [Planctomycetota bacterium]